MNSKLLGGILLVVGTTIGAGMLALPVATAQLGFWWSTALLTACWAIMTASAFLLIEVNLWFPANSNLISMASATLGRFGRGLTWIVYLLFLYSILAAYISGGGDLFHYLLAISHIQIPLWVASILFTAAFGFIVYFGIRVVDYMNRGLMSIKMGAYFLLVLLLLPFISLTRLGHSDLPHFTASTGITVSIVAFCCGMIVPSLRAYFGEDVRSLRQAIFFGTLIPLLCYIAWNLVTMGILPLSGPYGLQKMLHSASANSDLLTALTTLAHSHAATLFANCFVSVCMTTSFLSVSLCLSDFLADGLNIQKKGSGNIVIFGATFLPPLAVVLFYPDAFLRCLHYSGVYCVILMILLPAAMAWRGRYHWAMAHHYRVRGGNILLAVLALFATFMIGQGVLEGMM
jgi:tyrosine-specific transport protein